MNLDEEVHCHGITERTSCASVKDLCVEEISTKGFTVLRGNFDDTFVERLAQYSLASYARQAEAVGGEDNLVKINDANIARAPCVDFQEFVILAMCPLLHEVAREIFGPNYILYSQNSIINVPGTNHYQFAWHRDLNYQHFTSSRCLGLSAIFCVHAFNSFTGGTYVLPATHKVERFPSDRYVVANQICLNAEPGDWIIFDSMLFHRTGLNKSNKMRIGINHILVPPFVSQQYDFTSMIGNRLGCEAERVFFGAGRGTAHTAIDWRLNRIRRL
jgi:ectoine hydroxylase-related dioxygenase (phytanoyl-CoA dioxygenase family)